MIFVLDICTYFRETGYSNVLGRPWTCLFQLSPHLSVQQSHLLFWYWHVAIQICRTKKITQQQMRVIVRVLFASYVVHTPAVLYTLSKLARFSHNPISFLSLWCKQHRRSKDIVFMGVWNRQNSLLTFKRKLVKIRLIFSPSHILSTQCKTATHPQ